MSSSPPVLDPPRSRPIHHMPTRLLSSLKRPFSRSKPEPTSSILPDRTRDPSPGANPPSYEQIAMGLHLSRTPHFPAHLAHLYPHPPLPQQRLQRCVSSPASSTPHRPHKGRPNPAHLYPSYPSPSRSLSHTPSTTPSPSPSRSYTRLPPPPARSALKKPHVKATHTSSSGMTPDTASASTAASSITPSTPTNSSARSGLLSRFLGKERGTTPPLVAIIAEAEPSEPERKAVRFGGVEEEDG